MCNSSFELRYMELFSLFLFFIFPHLWFQNTNQSLLFAHPSVATATQISIFISYF